MRCPVTGDAGKTYFCFSPLLQSDLHLPVLTPGSHPPRFASAFSADYSLHQCIYMLTGFIVPQG